MLVPLRSSENLFGGPAAIGGGSAERLRFIFQKEGRSSPAGRIGPRRLSGARGFVSGSTRYLRARALERISELPTASEISPF
jgi:hypothetical protein